MSQERNAISLDEERAVQEAALQSLTKRQQDLRILLENTRTFRQRHVHKLEELRLRREGIEEAREKHSGLQQELQDALKKTQERLARVDTAYARSLDSNDEEDIMEEEGNSSGRNEETNQVEEQVEREEEGTVDVEKPDERIQFDVPDLHTDANMLIDFWKSRIDSGFVAFLPCIDSAVLIQRIMDLTALETLALDASYPQGNHRQESLRRTCLDFFATAAASVPQHVNASHEVQSAPSATIDPNVALCPYELAGVCADVYCPYQHMKPRSTPILARERLPLPTLKLPPAVVFSWNGQQQKATKMESMSPSPLQKSRRKRPSKRRRKRLRQSLWSQFKNDSEQDAVPPEESEQNRVQSEESDQDTADILDVDADEEPVEQDKVPPEESDQDTAEILDVHADEEPLETKSQRRRRRQRLKKRRRSEFENGGEQNPVAPPEDSDQGTAEILHVDADEETVNTEEGPNDLGFRQAVDIDEGPTSPGSQDTENTEECSNSTGSRRTVDVDEGPGSPLSQEAENAKEDPTSAGSLSVPRVQMEWNDDFVSLPSAPTAVDDNDSASSEHGSASAQLTVPDVADLQAGMNLWWHTDEDISRIENSQRASPTQVSFMQWLEDYGGFAVSSSVENKGRSISCTVFKGCPASNADMIALAARVVDCVRLSIHAGQFDVAHALCGLFRILLEGASPDSSDESLAMNTLLMKAIRHVETTCQAAFRFNSNLRSTLHCAFVSELTLATMTTFLRLLHKEQSSDSNELSVDRLREWSDALDEAIILVQEHPLPRDTTREQDNNETKRHNRQGEYNFLRVQLPAESDMDYVDNKNDKPGVPFHLEMLHESVRNGQTIMQSSSQSTVESLVEDFLNPALSDIRRFADGTNVNDEAAHCAIQSTLYTMGYLLLGCAESACSHVFSRGGHLDADSLSTLTSMDSSIHQIVTALTALASTEPLAELTLAPLHALSVSLASTLRRYGKAQHRLEAALNGILAKRHGYACVFSELLWSQLIQLRASLPLGKESSLPLTLPDSIASEHANLATSITQFGVYPNHVTLCGDWNLLKAFVVDSKGSMPSEWKHIRRHCRSLVASIFSNDATTLTTTTTTTTFSMSSLALTTGSSLAFPRSIFLGNIGVLAANNCQLRELPVSFGLYFFNLKALNLCHNELQELPASIDKMTNLSLLDVSNNRLKSCHAVGELRMLVKLNVAHNELTSLPPITECTALEELTVTDNPDMQASIPSDLPLRLPNLWRLES